MTRDHNHQQPGPTVVIAGATGFVGQALMKKLAPRYQVIGLTRSRVQENKKIPIGSRQDSYVSWRQCNLFSRSDTARALAGADYAFYLVHSMMPSARLTQGSFYDMDLILADNFAQTAAQMGVKQIIYLGGLIPRDQQLSKHLESRLEVEETLGTYGVPVTALRAGLVVGANGSTFQIVASLVKRFRKIMFLPGMLDTMTHPIALSDVLEILEYCIGNQATFNQSFDVGGPETMTYREMIIQVARIAGYRPVIYSLPTFSHRLTSWLLGLLTGSPQELVAPLVESLQNPMVAKDTKLQQQMNLPGMSFQEAVQLAMKYEQKHQESIRIPRVIKKKNVARVGSTVRSVQRIPLPEGLDACWISRHYAPWLASFFRRIILVEINQNGDCFFYLSRPRILLLELTYVDAKSSNDRPLYHITGGLLNRRVDPNRPGRLEFRTVLQEKYALAAIHDYTPTLPWFIYNLTQARVHLWVMNRFSKHLAQLSQNRARCASGNESPV